MSLSKRSTKKITQAELDQILDKRKRGPKSLECECGAIVENVSHDAGAVTCWRCVSRQVAPPHNYVSVEKRNEEKKPRGWHFMEEYISPSGKVYHKGRLVDEHTTSDEASVPGNAVRSASTKSKSNATTSTKSTRTSKNKSRKRS